MTACSFSIINGSLQFVSCTFSLSCSILVNTTSSVKLYYFAKLSWDYESAEGGRDDVSPREDSVSENSPASLRKHPVTSSGAGHMAQGKTMRKRAELLKRSPLPFTPAKRQTQGKHAQVYIRGRN